MKQILKLPHSAVLLAAIIITGCNSQVGVTQSQPLPDRVIKPGDHLSITLATDPPIDSKMEFRRWVAQGGSLNVTSLGDIPAGGLTPGELEKAIDHGLNACIDSEAVRSRVRFINSQDDPVPAPFRVGDHLLIRVLEKLYSRGKRSGHRFRPIPGRDNTFELLVSDFGLRIRSDNPKNSNQIRPNAPSLPRRSMFGIIAPPDDGDFV